MLYCAKCSQVYDDSLSKNSELMDEHGDILCPSLGCFGVLVDLDENMVPLVQMFCSHDIDVIYAHSPHIYHEEMIVRGSLSFPVFKGKDGTPIHNFIKKFVPPEGFEVVLDVTENTNELRPGDPFSYVRGCKRDRLLQEFNKYSHLEVS